MENGVTTGTSATTFDPAGDCTRGQIVTFLYRCPVSYTHLEYMEYTGCTVNFKTYTNSIWDKKQRENPIAVSYTHLTVQRRLRR